MFRVWILVYMAFLFGGCDCNPSLSHLSEFRLPHAPKDLGRITGKQFILQFRDSSPDLRELEIENQIISGNFPDHLRNFIPVLIESRRDDDNGRRLIIFAMPDYLAVGTNQDHTRIPMRPGTAQRIAETLGLILPTSKIVDEIHQNSQFQLNPTSLPPSSQMTDMSYFLMHNDLVEKQLNGHARGLLISGHKKDIVITSRLRELPDRVAIYGWHRTDGKPVQRLNLDHGRGYADYSHGVRLIGRHAILDGKGVDLAELIEDPKLNHLISYEGPLSANIYERPKSRIGLAH
jgi:hypothetical protein